MNKTLDRVSLGKYMILLGLLALVPLVILFFHPEEYVYRESFLLSFLFSAFTGSLLCIYGYFQKDPDALRWKLRLQMSSTTVLFIWVWGMLVGALPFFLGGQLDFTRSLFEAVSGWTTTGFSVAEPEKLPKIFLFHRAFMQYVGGLGFVLVMVLFLPGRKAMTLFSGEGHPDRIMPSLQRTAQIVFLMYNCFFVVGTSLYILAGLPPLEAVCHTMSALSTGGFSTYTDSIGAYGSPAAEWVSILLMLVGMTNFYVMLQCFRGHWREAVLVTELRLMWTVVLAAAAFIALQDLLTLGTDAFGSSPQDFIVCCFDAWRRAMFLTASSLSGTGYGITGPEAWTPAVLMVMIVLMFMGGMSGSTAGGLKLNRVYVLLRTAGLYLRRRLVPNRTVIVPHYFRVEGRVAFDRHLVDEAIGFALIYVGFFLLTALALCFTTGAGLAAVIFEAASALGNVGISIGITGPETGDGALIVEMIAMMLGRLEIFIVLVGMYSAWQGFGGR